MGQGHIKLKESGRLEGIGLTLFGDTRAVQPEQGDFVWSQAGWYVHSKKVDQLLLRREEGVSATISDEGASSRKLRGSLCLGQVSAALIKDAAKLRARGDFQFRKDLPQMILDSARADEQASADFWVGQPLSGKPGDLSLLRG